jgi:protocatechuate 3,4-dioxygenase beta subunit
MLTNATYKRSDIREGKAGLPLQVVLNVSSSGSSCAAIGGATVMIWQCDATGNYSEYTQPGYDGTGETFLRGYQETDANGQVTFTSVYPGWYSGRATHIHIEVYVDGNVVKTTQMAFDDATTATVYATGVYAAHGQSALKNAADMVFSDGDEYELAALTGDATTGYTAKLTIGV